jgi:DNA polymerase I-like protein with 3'-5' exonuclease and polymerase domains
MTDKDYGVLSTVEEMKPYFKKVLNGGKTFAFDIESGYDGEPTNDLSTMVFHPRWKMVGFSFSDDTSWARYVPIAHDTGTNAPTVAAARLLWTLLQTGRGVPHNAMFELQGLSRWFREVLWDDTFFGEAVRKLNGMFPVLSDTMIEANMVQRYQPLSNGQGVGVGLKGLVKHIFGHQMTNLVDLFPDLKAAGNAKQLRFNILELNEDTIEYACEDSAWTLALHEHHYHEVKDSLMFRTEILLLPVLCAMEQEGLVLDWDEYERQEQIISHFKNALNEEIQADLSEKLGELVNVNFNSPKQVQELLFEKMKLPMQTNKKTGRPTTDDKAMNHLAKITNDPSLLKILEWRGVSKLLSSYITKYLKELRYDPSGRARPNHNQLGAGTGRFSVDGVSYQQWPKPYHFELKDGTALDLNYRNFLIAPEGFRIIGFDFAQVEMRVLAGVVGETAMLEAFERGEDLHKKTASVMFKTPLEEVTPKQRQAAKGLNFGILYGQGAAALAETLDISKEEAQDLLNDYFEGFSKLRAWMDDQVAMGQATGEVSTPFGRRFHIWNYDDSRNLAERASRLPADKAADAEKLRGLSRYVFSEGDRLCVNAAIQGGAADYMKLGMVRAQRAIKEAGLQDKIKLVMTIHDALEFYVHESVSTQEVIDLLNPMVSFPVQGFPEIRADWHEGKRWGEVLEIKLDKNKQIIGYEYEVVLADKRKFAGEFSTAEEGYEWLENLPKLIEESSAPETVEEVVETPEGKVVLIELQDSPDPTAWARVKEFLAERSEGAHPVYVTLDKMYKDLGFTLSGRESELEELRFILPEANFSLTTLDKVPVGA